MREVIDREDISVDSGAHDQRVTYGGEVRVMPKLLAGVHIGDVHLDRGKLHRCVRIT